MDLCFYLRNSNWNIIFQVKKKIKNITDFLKTTAYTLSFSCTISTTSDFSFRGTSGSAPCTPFSLLFFGLGQSETRRLLQFGFLLLLKHDFLSGHCHYVVDLVKFFCQLCFACNYLGDICLHLFGVCLSWESLEVLFESSSNELHSSSNKELFEVTNFIIFPLINHFFARDFFVSVPGIAKGRFVSQGCVGAKLHLFGVRQMGDVDLMLLSPTNDSMLILIFYLIERIARNWRCLCLALRFALGFLLVAVMTVD